MRQITITNTEEKERTFTILGVRVHFNPKLFRELLRNFTFGSEIETTFDSPYSLDNIEWDDIPEWMKDEYYDYLRENGYEEWEYEIWEFIEDFYPDYFESEDYSVVVALRDYLKVEGYYDQSCGMEFPTRTYNNIRDFYEVLVNVVKIIENNGYDPREVFDPHVPVGGHFNFSNRKAIIHKDISVHYWLLAFAGINTYLFADPRHDDRSNYNTFSYEFGEKFTAIHEKSYAIECRYFDGLTFPVSYTLNAVVNMVLAAFLYALRPADENKLYDKLVENGYYNISALLYNQWRKYGDNRFYEIREEAIKSYKLLTSIISKVNKYVREEWGINVLKGIRYQWLRGSPDIRIKELDNYETVKFYENQLARVMGLPPML